MGRVVDLYDVRKVDAALGATLEKLAAAAAATGGGAAAKAAPAAMLVDGCPLEDLCLSFVLPGAQLPPASRVCIPALASAVGSLLFTCDADLH